MKSFLFPLSLCLAVAIASTTNADVRDGSYWSGGGTTIAVDVADMGDGSVALMAVSSSGFSNVTTGQPGENSTANVPTCEDSGVMNVPTATGSMSVTVTDGTMMRRSGDQWIPMRKVTKRVRAPNWGGSHGDFTVLQPGEVAPWSGFLWSTDRRRVVWLDAGDVAPWLGMLVPGDEVESLPT